MPPIILDPTPHHSNPLHPTTRPHRSSIPATTRRTLYYAVKTGHHPGVYSTWEKAEANIKGHSGPQWKTFKTYLAAEAFVEGKDGGSFRVNHHTPIPLNEHLKSFPPSIPLSSPSPTFLPPRFRQSPSLNSHNDDADGDNNNNDNDSIIGINTITLKPPRPYFARSRVSSGGSSPVRRSSPLRREVTDDEGGPTSEAASEASGSESESSVRGVTTTTTTTTTTITRGWLSPPTSPKPSSSSSSSSSGFITTPSTAYIRPSSPAATIPRPFTTRQYSSSSATATTSGGLWGDIIQRPPTPPTSPPFLPRDDDDDLPIPAIPAPKFSRKNLNVIMPISARASAAAAATRSSNDLRPMMSRESSTSSLSVNTRAFDKHRSLPTMKSLKGLHEKLMALSTTREEETTKVTTTERPDIERLDSCTSIASMFSEVSSASFVTADEEIVARPGRTHLPTGLIITPLTDGGGGGGGSDIADEAMSPLTPATSNHSSHGGSIATHTQSEGAEGRYGRRKGSIGSGSTSSTISKNGKGKKGFGNKLMKALGLAGRVAAAGTGRRGSA